MTSKKLAVAAAALLLGGCANKFDLVKSDNYIRDYLRATSARADSVSKPTSLQNDFDREQISSTSTTERGAHHLIVDTHHIGAEQRNQHSLNAKYIGDLGNNWKVIVYGADTYAKNKGKVTDTFTNSLRADARIAKYQELGKNVMVYVEVGGRVEAFAYTNTDCNMNYTTGYALIKAGLVRRSNTTGEKTTKIQADLQAGTGNDHWNFSEVEHNGKIYPGISLDGQVMKVIGAIQASQKIPINLKGISRLNLIINGHYLDTNHSEYVQSQIGAAEAGLEFVIDKTVLGEELRLSIFAGGRQEIERYPDKGLTKHIAHKLNTEVYGRAGIKADWKLTDRIRALLEANWDGKNGLGGGAGFGITFGGK